MTPQYEAWQKSGHRHTAICVACHLPDAGIAKWVAKADQGFRHSAAFTLQNFKEPIEIKPRDRDIVRSQLRPVPRGLRPRGRREPAPAGPRLPALPRRRRARSRRMRPLTDKEVGGR